MTLGQLEQAVVGNTAPQEERQSRRSFDVAELIPGLFGRLRRSTMYSEKKVGVDQKTFKRKLDALIECSGCAAFVEKPQQRLYVAGRHRSPVSQPRQP